LKTVLDSINSALYRALESDPSVVLLGEDLLDPYGGAFKATRGLSSSFPGRVLSTPISEAGIVGVATGMALRGLRPVVEIMFGDFMTLVADQLINHATKFSWMYNDQVQVPLVIRTPMGGRRGYGPTHSQSIEKLFLGTPGLKVLAPVSLGDPGELLLEAIRDPGPVLFVENKLLYTRELKNQQTLADFSLRIVGDMVGEDLQAPAYSLTILGAPEPSLTMVTYGYMAELAMDAAYKLAFDHEVFSELVMLTQLAPLNLKPLWSSTDRTGRLVAIEEGSRSLGWGAEVLAQAAEAPGARRLIARRVAGLDLPVPASKPLEERVLPSIETIVQTALDISHGT
jgi:pyruvate/2-oxoglutarate/acetoin dehydrogenase E1 component